MKLKIVINKMNTFINDVVSKISKLYKISYKCYRFNYFDLYQNSISQLKEEEQMKIYSIIEKNSSSIDNYSINDIVNFLSYDISNESVIPDKTKIRNYIIFCLYCYILEAKIDTVYFNENNILNLKYKDRPHRFNGTVYTYNDNEFICNVYGIYLDDVKPFKNIVNKISKLKSEDMILPYCEMYDNIVVYEKLEELDPRKDPLITVLKDTINQLMNINKFYWFEYITKQDIGKSNINFKRYYISSFDTLIDKKRKITSFNRYDGRESYIKMSNKDQIRTVIHILSELYVTGPDDYTKKSKLQPFRGLLEYLEKLDDKTCHKEFIYYLIDTKI